MKAIFQIIVILFSFLLTNIAISEILTVDQRGTANYSVIQDAIDEASEGDIINIGPGVYNESLDVKKNVSLIGSGPNYTTIDTTSNLPELNLHAININKALKGKISGLKILSNGYGINFNIGGNSITICNCIIDSCSNGIYLSRFSSNTISIINNVIVNCKNSGIYTDNYQCSNKFYIKGNIIAHNINYGIAIINGGSYQINNNNIYENEAGNYGGNATVGTGDISKNPQFIDYETGNYVLKITSPCINTGLIGGTSADPDGSRNDMGAYAGRDATYFWPYQKGPLVTDLSVIPASITKGGKFSIKAKGEVR